MLKAFRSSLVLLPLAAASTAQAQSSVSIYGLMDVGLQQYRTSGSGFGGSTRKTGVEAGNMTTSFLGFSGSEDLGGGSRAVFSLETYVRPDTGESGRFGSTDALWKRNSYVGLDSTRFGRLILGRTGLPFFTTAAAFNPFGNSFRFATSIANLYNTDLSGVGLNTTRSAYIVNDSAWSNAVSYNPPSFVPGLQLVGMYSFATGSNATEDTTKTGEGWTVGAHYLPTSGPFSASASFQRIAHLGAGAAAAVDSQDAWIAGAAYDLQVVKLYAQYAQIKTATTSSGSDKDRMMQVGISAPLRAGRLMASYADSRTRADGGTAAPERGRRSWALGYDYTLSKRTDVYLAYSNFSLDATTAGSRGDKEQQTLGIGIRHKF